MDSSTRVEVSFEILVFEVRDLLNHLSLAKLLKGQVYNPCSKVYKYRGKKEVW